MSRTMTNYYTMYRIEVCESSGERNRRGGSRRPVPGTTLRGGYLAGLGLLLAGAIWIAGAGTGFSQTKDWDADGGLGGSWFVGDNWDADGVPTSTDAVKINDASRSDADNPVVINDASTAGALSVILGDLKSSGHAGYMDIFTDLTVENDMIVAADGNSIVNHSSGTVYVKGQLKVANEDSDEGIYNLSGTGILNVDGSVAFSRGDGIGNEFNQSGGTATFGANLLVGSGGNSRGDATYNLSAGTLSVTNKLVVGWKSDDHTFKQSGGTATFGEVVAGGDTNDGGVGEIRVSDSAKFTSNGLVRISDGGSNSGTGTLVLDGSKTGDGTDFIAKDDFRLNDLGTLQAIIDDDAITLASNLRLVDVTGDVLFGATSLILPEFDAASTPTAGTWVVMSWDGSETDSGLSLSGDAASGWSFDLDDINNQLTVTYTVPEPSTWALVAIGAVGATLVWRRRTRFASVS